MRNSQFSIFAKISLFQENTIQTSLKITSIVTIFERISNLIIIVMTELIVVIVVKELIKSNEKFVSYIRDSEFMYSSIVKRLIIRFLTLNSSIQLESINK